MKQLILGLSMLGCITLSAQTTTTAVTQSQSTEVKVPADFPPYVETGNKTVDDANFMTAVKAWTNTHPDQASDFAKQGVDILKFRSTASSQSTKVQTLPKRTISQKDFDALPQTKKDQILAHPDFFEITK